MKQAIAQVSFLVRDYDEAIDFFTSRLGFRVLEDAVQAPGRRWVVVGPPGRGARLVLARAKNAAERAAVGRQAGGRVFLFLETDAFAACRRRMLARGVVFREAPRREAYGTVAVFEDLYGNPWDLIMPRRRPAR
jgi:catechol 2,3-dioxygenase-like lactoylglutathione lyase family enzyme